MTEPASVPEESMSPRIKIFLIVSALLTFVGFIIFMFLVVKIAFPSGKSGKWEDKILVLGDKLKDAGLKQQAIEQYEKFLDKGKTDLTTRARISHAIGELYMETGDCPHALVWYFQVDLADANIGRETNVAAKIESCRKQIKNAS